jgi:hypothetical protein
MNSRNEVLTEVVIQNYVSFDMTSCLCQIVTDAYEDALVSTFRPSGLMLSQVKNYGGVQRTNQRRSESNTGNGSGWNMH